MVTDEHTADYEVHISGSGHVSTHVTRSEIEEFTLCYWIRGSEMDLSMECALEKDQQGQVQVSVYQQRKNFTLQVLGQSV